MNNFADAQKAYKLAIESSGSATTENERYLTSLSAKLSQLRAEFERLVLGDGGISSFI
jgi:TorA maturation chaperone TorD